MARLGYQFNDGGRSKYFRAANVGDCGVRAAAIASGRDYKEVYDLCKRIINGTPRNGIFTKDYKRIMTELGAEWHPLMGIGTGCKAHLDTDSIPMGRVICNVSRHFVAVIDHIVNDTYDCTRGGKRCVYGYWIFKD